MWQNVFSQNTLNINDPKRAQNYSLKQYTNIMNKVLTKYDNLLGKHPSFKCILVEKYVFNEKIEICINREKKINGHLLFVKNDEQNIKWKF